jgi:hypothetical protein
MCVLLLDELADQRHFLVGKAVCDKDYLLVLVVLVQQWAQHVFGGKLLSVWVGIDDGTDGQLFGEVWKRVLALQMHSLLTEDLLFLEHARLRSLQVEVGVFEIVEFGNTLPFLKKLEPCCVLFVLVLEVLPWVCGRGWGFDGKKLFIVILSLLLLIG